MGAVHWAEYCSILNYIQRYIIQYLDIYYITTLIIRQ